MEEVKKTVYDALVEIQSELKAPKGQYNNFGKYKYRSCEDILNAVKPLLKEHNAVLTITDDIVCIGERNYVRAMVNLCVQGCSAVTTQAFAREPLSKKGMDESQITGAASSYARKYALNGLFCIDDAKDADSQEPSKEERGITKEEKEVLDDWLLSANVTEERLLKALKLDSIDKMTKADYNKAIASLKTKAEKK